MKAYSEIRKDLFTFKSEKLSKLSILLVLILDVFVFTVILDGIENEQNKISSHRILYPYKCTSLFEDKNDIAYIKNNRHGDKFNYQYSGEEVELCKNIISKYNALHNNVAIKSNSKEYYSIKSKLYNVKRDIKRVGRRYDTELLEVVANQKNKPGAGKESYYGLLALEKALNTQLKLIPSISSYKIYKDYISFRNMNRQLLEKEKRSYKVKYKLISYAYLLKFILPLFFLALYVYFRNKKKQLNSENFNNISLIITSHMLLLLSLPIFFGFFDIVYYFIPKEILTYIIMILTKFEALFLGFYGIIILAILVIFALVYALQKYEKNKNKRFSVIYKSINKSICFNCKNKVDYRKDKHCSFCAEDLQEQCLECNELKIAKTPYCRHCKNKK